MMEWQGPRVFLNKLYREVQTGKEWMWVSFVAKDLKCDGVRSLYKNIKIINYISICFTDSGLYSVNVF